MFMILRRKHKSMKKKLNILLLILMLFTVGKAFAQDLGINDVEHALDRFRKKPFKFSGDISANQVFYGVSGIEQRRSPYTYYLSGNINVAFYGWNFPFTFSISDQESQYHTPAFQSYDRFGVAPYYKWVKIYAGHSNMSFSPYTFNGYTFLGGGVELTPGIFNFSAFYGRLHKAVEEDTAKNISPVYKRMGYGLKFGIKKDGDFIDLMFFKAEDKPNSLESVADNWEIAPGENLVMGIKAGKTVIESIKLEAEYATTAITRDVRLEKQDEKVPYVFSNMKGFFTPRVSSEYYDAFKASLNYEGNGYGLGAAYERIDPGYETMGAYYFNNDLEKITLNANTSLFKQKVQLAVNMGLERNNLDNDKMSTSKRTVGSVNASYTPSPKWNLSASYSNFTSFTNIRSDFEDINQINPVERIDTLNFTQLTQSTNANISYLIGDLNNITRKQFVNLNLTSQIAANEQQGNPNSGSVFYNGNLNYTISLIPKNMSITTAVTYNHSKMPETNTSMFGPMASVSKTFLEKTLRTMLSLAWNQTNVNEKATSNIINFRINATYNLKKKHNFNLSMVALNKTDKVQDRGNFTEYTLTMGYSYSFATSDEKKNVKEDE